MSERQRVWMLLDQARPLPQGLQVLVETWPRPAATAWAWLPGERRALLLRGIPQAAVVPLAQTPQGAQLGARILACQARHGPVTYVAEDHTVICHDCHAPWLWATPWAEDVAGG